MFKAAEPPPKRGADILQSYRDAWEQNCRQKQLIRHLSEIEAKLAFLTLTPEEQARQRRREEREAWLRDITVLGMTPADFDQSERP